jgi:hypothetical protein
MARSCARAPSERAEPHRPGQVHRPDPTTIYAVYRHDLVHTLDRPGRFDLDGQKNLVVNPRIIVSAVISG